MTKLNAKLSFINAWGYCLVAGLGMIVGSWKLMLLSTALVFVSHRWCIELEREIRHGLHGAPKDSTRQT